MSDPIRTTMTVAVAVVACLALSACASVEIKSEHDGTKDFDSFKNYAVLPSLSIKDPTTNEFMGVMIANELDRKGLKESDTDIDLFVTYDLRRSSREHIATGVGYAVETYNGVTTVYTVSEGIPVGALVIALVDARDGSVAWKSHGMAGLKPDMDPDDRVERLEGILSQIFASYPPAN